jgi:hypothetical protein
MVKCPRCGTSISNAANFCSICGETMKSIDPLATKTTRATTHKSLMFAIMSSLMVFLFFLILPDIINFYKNGGDSLLVPILLICLGIFCIISLIILIYVLIQNKRGYELYLSCIGVVITLIVLVGSAKLGINSTMILVALYSIAMFAVSFLDFIFDPSK